MLNLDTHILIYALAGRLMPRERALLQGDQWSVSAIVLWELAKLAQLGRINLDIHAVEFARALSGIHVWPLDLEVCRMLGSLDFRSDPADEIIAATSLAHRVALVTRDRRMRNSKIVPIA
ncbi:MAG: type II toxin-antitoxin system VapC family toxin [Acidobacteriia bacterium]|nr:type II toxin-antitoxin system VapC family toxin [Terriglobia bacterium]